MPPPQKMIVKHGSVHHIYNSQCMCVYVLCAYTNFHQRECFKPEETKLRLLSIPSHISSLNYTPHTHMYTHSHQKWEFQSTMRPVIRKKKVTVSVHVRQEGYISALWCFLRRNVSLGSISETSDGKRRREQQRMRCLDGFTDSVDVNFSKLQEMVEDRGACHAAVHGVAKSHTRLSDSTTTTTNQKHHLLLPHHNMVEEETCICS